MRVKHRKDYNHGKGGWIGPNPRYSGQRRTGRAANAGNDSRYYRVRNPKFEDIYYLGECHGEAEDQAHPILEQGDRDVAR
jgi:hypothetical protein